MSIHVHHLQGCAPAPLAHYLKALGILRLVAEQADPTARLWWQDEHACLATKLDESALTAFFANTYRPTPMVAPWNAGSGFYPKDVNNDESESDEADDDESSTGSPIEKMEESEDERLAGWRKSIRRARDNECRLFQETLNRARQLKSESNRNKNNKDLSKQSKQADEKKKALKDELVACAFKTWRGHDLEWLSAAAVATVDGDRNSTVYYPQHLGGSGGANAKLDYTANFCGCILFALSPDNKSESFSLLKSALFGRPTLLNKDAIDDQTIGQFMPATVKAANGATGFFADRQGNPWDLILLMEGVILLRCGTSRRLGELAPSSPAAPFSIQASISGVAGGSVAKDNASVEQWLPLWKGKAGIAEIQSLFQRGRIAVGRKTAGTALDAAQALKTFGAPLGIDRFIRFGFPQRNGKGHFATNFGIWKAHENGVDSLSLISPWIQQLIWKSKIKNAPSAWRLAANRCEESILACYKMNEQISFQRFVLCIGDAEAVIACNPARASDAGLRPLPKLPASWLHALPNSTELRLAAAIAAQTSDGLPLRRHWWTPDPKEPLHFAAAADVEVVATSGRFVPDAVAILRRRCRGGDPFPLHPHPRIAASPADLADLLAGVVDIDLMWSLVQPLLALDWSEAQPIPAPAARREDRGRMAVAGLFRLVHAAFPLPGAERPPAVDPIILGRLLAGDASTAARLAARHLTARGLRPHGVTAVADAAAARMIAASLLIPISFRAQSDLCQRLTHPVCEPVTQP